MEFTFFKARIKIDFTFIFVLIAAVLLGYTYLPQILLFSVLHETGHIIALIVFKTPPYKIIFSFYGVGLKYEGGLSPLRETVVAAAGPLVNLIMFLVLKDEVNLFLLIINLFPAFPLDGGRIIKALVPDFYTAISLAFVILLFAVSLYLLFVYNVFSLLLIAVYLLIFNLRLL